VNSNRSNSPTSKNFVFVVENLRVGGIQRLVLDECYQLIAWGHHPSIISLSTNLDGDSMLETDTGFPLTENLNITYLNGNKFLHLRHFIKLLQSKPKGSLVISHSASAVPILRVASILLRRKTRISLFIHQLLTLSDRKQKVKRIFYSFFANEIAFSSKQFQLDWQFETKENSVLAHLLHRKMNFDRMGVYLPRLKWGELNGERLCISSVPHLIFMSRISSWKGSKDYLEICRRNVNENLHAIAFISRTNRSELFNSTEFSTFNSHVVYEKGLTGTYVDPRSIHIYPSNYGARVRFPQSIGMNVLEMVGRNIPSLISAEGFESWPELENSQLVKVVNWNLPTEVDGAISSTLNLTLEERVKEKTRLEGVISIEKHVSRIVDRY
jgi:hypothetical protein